MTFLGARVGLVVVGCISCAVGGFRVWRCSLLMHGHDSTSNLYEDCRGQETPSPEARSWPIFSAGVQPSAVRPWPHVPSSCLEAGAPTARHHTRMEVRSPRQRRGPQALGVVATTAPPRCPRRPSSATSRRHGTRGPVRVRLGGGAAPVTPTRLSPALAEPERMSPHREGRRGNGLGAPGRSRRRTCVITAPSSEAHPLVVP